MLRVLSPDEQSCLTVDAQALIYQYCSRKWLQPRQLEELITQVVTISHLRRVPGDVELVTTVLHCMGEPETSPHVVEINMAAPDAEHHLLS